MSQTPALDFANFLADNGLGQTGVDLFVGSEPAIAGTLTTIYDTSGNPVLTDHDVLRECTIQVRVKSPSYQTGYEKQEEVFNLVAGLQPVEIGNFAYPGIWATTDIVAIGRDDDNRHIFTANYRLMREPLEDVT